MTNRPFRAIALAMSRRLTTGLLLLLALFLVPLQGPVQACGMSTACGAKMKCGSCCATMKSCVLPQQNPSQPSKAPVADTVLVTLAAPAAIVLLQELFARPIDFGAAETPRLSAGPSRLAVLCTFLI